MQFESSTAERLLIVFTVGPTSGDCFVCVCWRSIRGLICDWLMSSRMESRSGFYGVYLVLELQSSSILPLIILVVSALRFSSSKYVRMLFLHICFTDYTLSLLFWSLFLSVCAWLLLLSVK